MNPTSRLLQKLRSGEARIGVIGLGYVGLPLACAFADEHLEVLGFDVDLAKIDSLNRGESYIQAVSQKRLGNLLESGHFAATSDLARLGEPDAICICVPTPLGPNREPDLRYVESTGRALAAALRPGQLVVLESTTYPGTTQEVLKPILETSGLEAGEDFFIAYSPEREDPGNSRFDVRSIPKVVGADDPASGETARELYEKIVTRVVLVSSSRAAEATKLTENIYRAVNIALVNELKMVYDHMGIDVWEVLEAAETKPFGFKRFNPGPGWGGHCIPIDPFYLAWKARQSGPAPRFVELAGLINTEMPGFVLDKLTAALEENGRELDGSRVLVLGLSYKRNIADPRESPAFEILSRLLEVGAKTSYHDPHILRAPKMRSWDHLPQLESQPLTAELLASQDAVVLITDHDEVNYKLVAEHAKLVVDTRGVFRPPGPNVIGA